MGRLEEILDNHIEGGAGAWKKLYDDIEIYTKECIKASLEKAKHKLEYEYSDYEETPDFEYITSEENIILL